MVLTSQIFFYHFDVKWVRYSIVILFLSTIAILSALGIKNQSISSTIRRINPHLWQNDSAVFIIYQVDTCCRPVIRLKEILAKKKIILFVFHPDFSDEDIENFKNIFKISQEALAERMNNRWEKVFSKLQKNKKNRNRAFLNYCIDISPGKINPIEAF